MQSQLPILLSEYHFYKIEDVDNYLTLLSQIKPYYESLIIFEKKRVELGFCMSDSSLNKVILQCSQIMNDQTLAQGTHFLITTFNDRISELVSANLLTESEADEYKNQNISL